jgi:hypothetical protein
LLGDVWVKLEKVVECTGYDHGKPFKTGCLEPLSLSTADLQTLEKAREELTRVLGKVIDQMAVKTVECRHQENCRVEG